MKDIDEMDIKQSILDDVCPCCSKKVDWCAEENIRGEFSSGGKTRYTRFECPECLCVFVEGRDKTEVEIGSQVIDGKKVINITIHKLKNEIPLGKTNIETNQLYYYIYQDDGPLGICGQSMSITRPWRQLWISNRYVTDYEMKEELRKISSRKNPRITGFFSADENADGETVNFINIKKGI